MNWEAVEEAAGVIRGLAGNEGHDVLAVLGSGLGDYPTTLPDAIAVPYSQIPGFPLPQVAGHSGTLYSARLGTKRILFLSGRAHAYEGHPMDKVVLAVRAGIRSGCGTVLLTNAAGGCGDHLTPGDLALITDHINLAGLNPLVGMNDSRYGPRFPDMTGVYSPELRAVAALTGDEVGVPVKEGVYAWFLGPSFETPAEIAMAKRLGADLVGMSTVPEAIAARHMGAEVIGISLVTNLAAGLSPTPISHEEVSITAEAARDRFTRLLNALLPRL
jgi:purine-nucleoside phosphorylase